MNDDIKVNWNKFYGQVCPVCRKPIMTKEWKRTPYFVRSGYLTVKGHKPYRHARFIYLDHLGDGKHKYYPVHEACNAKIFNLN